MLPVVDAFGRTSRGVILGISCLLNDKRKLASMMGSESVFPDVMPDFWLASLFMELLGCSPSLFSNDMAYNCIINVLMEEIS